MGQNPYESPQFIAKKTRKSGWHDVDHRFRRYVIFVIVVTCVSFAGWVAYDSYRMEKEYVRLQQERAELLDKTAELLRQRAKYESRVTSRPRRIERIRRSFP